jgi:beta-glucosidase
MLQEILKGDWKFDGVVISDWDATHNTDEAALNGLDLEMGTDSWNAGVKKMSPENCFMGNKYMEKIKTGELPVQSLDDKVRRILRLMLRTSMRKDKGLGCMTNEAHYSTAEEIGNEAIVLLQNRNSLLPLRSGAKKILVVGDNAKRMLNEGGNSSELKAKDMISPLQGLIDEYGDKVVYTLGYSAGESVYGRAKGVDKATGDSLIAKATEMAKDADVVIFVGGLNKNEQQDCEGADRISYSLPFRQNELIESLYKANKNIVALLLCGTAVEIPWSDKVPAILNCWYLGSMGGKSIANVVSGKTNPSGKLPFTIGKKLNDYGSHSYDKLCFPGENGRVEYKEDILVGYRWFDTKNITPLFAFGHGKSYTQFSYGKPDLSSKSITDSKGLTVRIPVKNAGKRAGKEVVQLYVGEDNSKVLRPEKELKHFKKVMIQPGETEIVEFSISADDLKYYSDTDKCWKADKGNFTVSIGSSSADIRQKIKIVYE